MTKLNRPGDRARYTASYDVATPSKPADFVGRPDPSARAPDEIDEAPLLRLALSKLNMREMIAGAARFSGPTWMLVGAERRHVFPSDPLGKPGDFDIIIGDLADGVPQLGRLVAVEVKRTRIRADHTRTRRKHALDFGTAQARGAAMLGFDAVLITHLVVGPDAALRTPPGKVPLVAYEDVVRIIARGVRDAQLDWSRRPFGLLVIEWARAPGTNIVDTGTVAGHLAATTRSLVVNKARRAELEAYLRRALPPVCPDVVFADDTQVGGDSVDE